MSGQCPRCGQSDETVPYAGPPLGPRAHCLACQRVVPFFGKEKQMSDHDPYREVGMDQPALTPRPVPPPSYPSQYAVGGPPTPRVSFPDPHAHDFGDARCACGETARALIGRCFETMAEQADYSRDLLTEIARLENIVRMRAAERAATAPAPRPPDGAEA